MFYSISSVRRKRVGRSERVSSIFRLARNVTLCALTLIVLFIAGGVAYVLLAGRSTTAFTSPATISSQQHVLKPSPPDPRRPVGAAVQGLTSPLKAGQSASLSVKTNAGAQCQADIAYPDSFLGNKTLSEVMADTYGVSTWHWTLAKDVPVGTWPITVTCRLSEKSAVVQADFAVAH